MFSLPDDRRANAAERLSTAADRMQSRAERFFRPRMVGFLFAVVVLILAAISIRIVVKTHNNKVDDRDTPNVSESGNAETAGDKDFLLAFVDDSDNTIRMLAVLHADEGAGRFTARYVSPTVVVNVNNTDGMLQTHYQSSGAQGLCAAVQTYLQGTGDTNLTIDNYLLFDDDNFTSMAKMMGDFSLDVDTRIEFHYKGIPNIIEPGTKITTPDMLCKYFAYLCSTLYSGGEAAVTDLLRLLATKMFMNLDPSEPTETRLRRFVDCADDTNVTAMDISTYAASLPAYVTGREMIEIACVGVDR